MQGNRLYGINISKHYILIEIGIDVEIALFRRADTDPDSDVYKTGEYVSPYSKRNAAKRYRQDSNYLKTAAIFSL